MRRMIVALVAAALAPAAVAQNTIKVGVVTFLSGPAASPFGVPAKNAAEFVAESLNQGNRAEAVREARLRRCEPRARVRRRGGQHHDAGDRIPQPGAAGERRPRHRLRVERQLPGHRAGGGGAEEAGELLRLRHAAHLRGREVQLRVPHLADRHHGLGGRGAVRARRQAGRQVDRRHQPELRLGPGFLGRLRGGDEGAGAERRGQDLANAEAVRRPVQRRDLGAALGQAAT